MAREYCRILTSIWGDEFTKRTAAAQRLYFLILSQPEVSMCGVLTPAMPRWADLAKDTTGRQLKAALTELSDNGYVVHDERTVELWIRSFVRHDLKLGTPNVAVGMTKAFSGVRSQAIRQGILKEIHKDFPEGFVNLFPDDVRCRFDKAFVKAEREVLGHAS